MRKKKKKKTKKNPKILVACISEMAGAISFEFDVCTLLPGKQLHHQNCFIQITMAVLHICVVFLLISHWYGVQLVGPHDTLKCFAPL